MGATVLDGLIVGVPATLLTYAASARVRLLVLVVAQLAYTTALLHRRGQTVGMRAVGTRLVVAGGGPPSTQQALTRSAVAAVSNILSVILPALGLVGLVFTILDVLWPLWDDRNQTLHDKAIGSLVVRDPVPGGPPPPPPGAWSSQPGGWEDQPQPWSPTPPAPPTPPPAAPAEPGAPAAWYPDPAGTPQERWWDGRSWTDHLRNPV